MKITCLGTGSAFTIANYHTMLLLEDSTGHRLLYDCGGDFRHASEAAGEPFPDSVFISHLHGDHIHGLEYLGFLSHFAPELEKPNLYATKPVLDGLHQVLMPTMKYLPGRDMELFDYFVLNTACETRTFRAGAMECLPVKMDHFEKYDGGIVYSYGLVVKDVGTGKSVFITGDCRNGDLNAEALIKHGNDVDVIFHDCETLRIQSNCHARWEYLERRDKHLRRKMWLTHFQDNVLLDSRTVHPDWNHWVNKKLFLGFALPGQQIIL